MAFASLALTAVLASASKASAESPTALLREAMAAPTHVSYVGEMQTLRIGEQRGDVAVYRVEHRAPNLTRRWYVAPQDLYGDSVILRGDTSYSIDVKRNRVVVSENRALDDRTALANNFGLMTGNYRAVYGANETIDTRPVRVVVLINKFTGQTTMRFHIDAQTKLVLESERFASDGSLVEEKRFEHVRYTNNLPGSLFAVPKHMTTVEGAKRTRPSNDIAHIVKSIGFSARGPKYLPEGFVPIAGNVLEIKGVRTLHLLYSDGIRSVSLFEDDGRAAVDLERYHPRALIVDANHAQYAQDGPTSMLAWADDRVNFMLVGELGVDELVKIGNSVSP